MYLHGRHLGWVLLLLAVACESSPPAPTSDSFAPLMARLDEVDTRIAGMEAKLDGAVATLDVVATWVNEQTEAAAHEEARRAARSSEREREREERAQRRAERTAARGDSGFASGDYELPPPASGREIEGAAAGIQCEEVSDDSAKCSVDRAFLDTILANPALLAKQARVVPSQKDGVTQGYKLYGIRRGSLPKLLSMKNGDMIIAVNDNELSSIDEAMAVYTKLRDAKHFDIEILRKGSPYDLSIEIVE